MDIIKVLAKEFKIRDDQVTKTVELIDEGNTVPFIARYRKEVTGGLDDVTLRELDERLAYLRGLEERKEEVIRLIDEQGMLTEELEEEIRKAQVLQRVEDLYKPFKKKKATRASKAKEKGLEPLAMIITAQQLESGTPEDAAAEFVDPEKGVESAEEALQGAADIIAEMISEDADLIDEIRSKTYNSGIIVTDAQDPEEQTAYDMYYGKSEGISKNLTNVCVNIGRSKLEQILGNRNKSSKLI